MLLHRTHVEGRLWFCLIQEFNMQSVQRRLSRMKGDRDDNEEALEHETKIRQLTDELDEKTSTRNFLTDHIKRVNVRR